MNNLISVLTDILYMRLISFILLLSATVNLSPKCIAKVFPVTCNVILKYLGFRTWPLQIISSSILVLPPFLNSVLIL